MATAGRITGLVIQAMRFLGQDKVNAKVVAKIDEQLTSEDRRTLIRDIKLAPAWIADIFRELAESEN